MNKTARRKTFTFSAFHSIITLFISAAWLLAAPVNAEIFGGSICSKDIPQGDFLCGSDEVCGDFGTCVPECNSHADCPLNDLGLTYCDAGACSYVRGAAAGTPYCEGEVPGDWLAHFVDGSVSCDPVPRVSVPIETRGGDNGADGVDVCDADADGDLDIVTGWEEGGEVILYLNPLRDANGGYSPRDPWIRVDARGRGASQNNDIGKRKPAPGVEDFVFADLVNRSMTTGQGLCPPGLIPDTYISAQEAQSRKVVMRTPAVNDDELKNGELWEAREFGDTEKYFMQVAVGDVDGKNCNDVVVGAKSGKAPLFGGIPNPFDDIDGGIWWFKCPAVDGDNDISATEFQNLYSGNRDIVQTLLRNKVEEFNLQANGPWKRRKLADGLFFMNVVLEDVDGDGDKDVVFSDRRRIGWMINPRIASNAEPGEPARDPFKRGPDNEYKWTRVIIESDDDIVQWCVNNQIPGSPGTSPCPFVSAQFRDSIPKEVFRDMAYVDLDGDNRKDIIAATNYYVEEGNVVARWYRRTGGVGLKQDWQVYEISAENLPFGREAGVNAPPVSKSVSVADIDGDGDNDLVLTVRGGGHGVYALTFPEDPDNLCDGPCINPDGKLRGTWSMIPIAPSYPVMKYDNVVLADFDEDCDIDAVTAEEFVVDHGVGLGVPWYENPLTFPPKARCRAATTLVAPADTCSVDVTVDQLDLNSIVDTSEFAGGSLGVRQACANGNCDEVPFAPWVTVNVGGPTGVTLGATHDCSVERTGRNPESQCTTQVTVLDRQAPEISCPGPQTLECRNGSATLNYALPKVTDNCDVDMVATCDPVSGSSFDVGPQRSVSCNVTDSSDQTSSCSFNYEVVDTLPPDLPNSLPIKSAECTGPMTAVALVTPEATDRCDGSIAAVAKDGLPAEFKVGDTPVKWVATDEADLTDEVTQIVRVFDLDAPTINAPEDVRGVECAAPKGTAVALGAPEDVDDVCDENPEVSNNSPALFGLGETTVTWTAIDGSDNSATDVQIVEVLDTIAPVFDAVDTLVVECASPNGTPANLVTPGLKEDCDANPEIGNEAPAVFDLGDNPVTWTATDASDNSSTLSQIVRVQDTLAPTISCADSQELEPISPEGVPAFFKTTATDMCSADPAVSCDADSGDIFPIGETTPVNCQASDESGNQSQCGFSIRVLSCPELAQSLQERAQALDLNSGRENSLIQRLDNVQRSLERGRSAPACGQVNSMVNSLEAWVKAGQLSAELVKPYLDSLGRLAACSGC